MSLLIFLLLIIAGIVCTSGFRNFPKLDKRVNIRSQIFTATEVVASTILSVDEVNKAEGFIETFIDGWSRGIQGNLTSLNSMVLSNTLWDNPFVSTSIEQFEGLQKFSEFFIDPSLVVFQSERIGTHQFSIDYQLSFWYPSPWRPRIIIPATAMVTATPDFLKILSVTEKWDVSIFDIFLKQFLPRFWDVWHVFCSPSPEKNPEIKLSSVGKVTLATIPNSVAIEFSWTGLAKYSGPPLLALPGFCLQGELRTSRPNRDIYYTVLPIEVQSSRYVSSSGQEMKRSSWILQVPTALQSKVLEKARKAVSYVMPSNVEEEEGVDDLVAEVDYTIGLENLDVMKRVTGGAVRGNFEVNREVVDEFLASERKEVTYRILPRRTIAQVDVFGEATPEKISAAIQDIKLGVEAANVRRTGKRWQIKPVSSLNVDKSSPGCGPDTNPLGLQLCYVKGCFNMKGEPCMAIYEMQYGRRHTKVFLELEEI